MIPCVHVHATLSPSMPWESLPWKLTLFQTMFRWFFLKNTVKLSPTSSSSTATDMSLLLFSWNTSEFTIGEDQLLNIPSLQYHIPPFTLHKTWPKCTKILEARHEERVKEKETNISIMPLVPPRTTDTNVCLVQKEMFSQQQHLLSVLNKMSSLDKIVKCRVNPKTSHKPIPELVSIHSTGTPPRKDTPSHGT